MLFGDVSPIRDLLIFCGRTENALRRPWQAIQRVDCPRLLAEMAALGMTIRLFGLLALAFSDAEHDAGVGGEDTAA